MFLSIKAKYRGLYPYESSKTRAHAEVWKKEQFGCASRRSFHVGEFDGFSGFNEFYGFYGFRGFSEFNGFYGFYGFNEFVESLFR